MTLIDAFPINVQAQTLNWSEDGFHRLTVVFSYQRYETERKPVNPGQEYVSDDNSRQIPVMLHRAIVGSMERFIGILIENHAGALPLWLAPVQVSVLNISESQAEYAMKVAENLKKQGFRVNTDLRNEKITYKIREHSIQKLPYIIVIGDKERDANSVAVRTRGNLDLGVMTQDALIERLHGEIRDKL